MKTNYLIIGDSIAYGVGATDNGGFSNLLKSNFLKSESSKKTENYVHCIGFPGATSKDILDKMPTILNLYYSLNTKNVLIVLVGINDTQFFKEKFKVQLAEFKNNITKMIDIVKQKDNCKIVFLGLTGLMDKSQLLLWKTDKFYNYEEIDKYDNTLKNICDDEKVDYIPLKNILTEDDYIDGLHPNDRGYLKIFDEVWNYINN